MVGTIVMHEPDAGTAAAVPTAPMPLLGGTSVCAPVPPPSLALQLITRPIDSSVRFARSSLT